MKITTEKNILIKPLILLAGIVEKKQTLPILANILLKAGNNRLTMTATDLEIEMKISISAKIDEEFEITLPARKLTDICRALPGNAEISINIKNERALIKSGKGRFSLGTLNARKYPNIEPSISSHRFSILKSNLKSLFVNTQFAMASQDVRYYLNGMLLELKEGYIRTVSTDGHRLALSELDLSFSSDENVQIIIPRKAILELIRLLEGEDIPVEVEISANHFRVYLEDTTFITKLIDGSYPDYDRVMPKNCDKIIIADKTLLKEALQRTAILSNTKFKGVNFSLSENKICLLAHNPEQEEATDEIPVQYNGEELSISFNVSYVIDAINAIESSEVKLFLGDSNSSCLIESAENDSSRYVVMPMRI